MLVCTLVASISFAYSAYLVTCYSRDGDSGPLVLAIAEGVVAVVMVWGRQLEAKDLFEVAEWVRQQKWKGR